MRNLGKMQEEVNSLCNRTRSARLRRQEDIDTSINRAIIAVVKDRYDNVKQSKGYSFEAFQRIRSELYTISKSMVVLTPNTNVSTPNVFLHPADYGYDTGLRVLLSDNTKQYSKSMTFNEKPADMENTLERPESDLIKHQEHSEGIEVLTGGAVSVMTAWLSYLKKPIEISSGVGLNNSKLLIPSTRYYVESGSILYDGMAYMAGDDFVSNTLTAFTGTGIVYSIVNTDLPWQLHDEICAVAADMLLDIIGDREKSQVMKVQEARS